MATFALKTSGFDPAVGGGVSPAVPAGAPPAAVTAPAGALPGPDPTVAFPVINLVTAGVSLSVFSG